MHRGILLICRPGTTCNLLCKTEPNATFVGSTMDTSCARLAYYSICGDALNRYRIKFSRRDLSAAKLVNERAAVLVCIVDSTKQLHCRIDKAAALDLISVVLVLQFCILVCCRTNKLVTKRVAQSLGMCRDCKYMVIYRRKGMSMVLL
ncbi:uncharacterized protein PHALS_14630 [Plasmopara halstedii]|uniref:Uncharacterized protein n=1 Tax=Plasmopara halstedii TaxID=4781 RepID=A0A0P1AM92_PLAHL|nr:uncharacterized protein PHALS_14630 [Plasmopara halstedii]CEG42470.1 hypothetical protein PHALS_14630 [Plasmopara halstedii]|eukprot:XP_024578839.1 hypothetical protein PHALS_14630 [Plasmopara halstedii]